MSVLDFLFEGKPPKSVTTYGETVENVPRWMSDYTQGLIAKANAVAAEPYQPYQGPRIAGFSPDQLNAFNATRANTGAFRPYTDDAGASIRRGAGANPLSAAQPYINNSLEEFPQGADRYMDPYIQNVLNRQRTLASRNLTEDFIPALQKAFIGAGQFGSSGNESMQEMGLRGVRDISEGLEEQRLASLSGAYEIAGRNFAADRDRAAGAADLTGRLSTAGGELGIQGGRELGALGEATQTMGLRDAAALEGIGAQQQGLGQSSLDLAYGDFERQRNYPMEQTGFLSEIVRGLPPSAVPRSIQTTEQGPASIYGASPLSQLAGAGATYGGLKEAGVFRRGGLHRASRYFREGGPVIIEGEYEVVNGQSR